MAVLVNSKRLDSNQGGHLSMRINKDISNQIQLKYFIYCRKSSEDEGKQILSLPAQKKELFEYAEKFGLKIVDVYLESQSAFKPGRIKFDEMVKRVENGEGNGVLVWQANRIARNSLDGGRFIYLMDEGKIRELKTPGRTFTNSSDDKFILNIEFGMAKKDSDDKSENVKRGNSYKFFEKKQWIGPAKPGYINVTNPLTKEKEIAVDKERFPLIQKAMRLILSGTYTPMEALHKLNREWGFRSKKTRRQGGKPLAKSGFYKLLADPFYYGLMVRSEGEQTGSHKSMISKEEFDRLQIILGRKGRPHITKHEFSYKEVIKCGECGGSITAEEKWHVVCTNCKKKFHKGKTRLSCLYCGFPIEEMKNPKIYKHVLFTCVRAKKRLCGQKSINVKEIEKRIDNELSKFEITEHLKEWAVKYLNDLNQTETGDRENYRLNLENAKNDCVKRLDNLVKLKISPQNTDGSVLSDEEYNQQRAVINSEKESIERELKKVDERINRWHELTVKTFNFACYARYWFANGDVKTKTEVLGALGSNLIVKDKILLIDRHEMYFLIEKGRKEVEDFAKKFEPEKYLDMIVHLDSFEPLRSAWLRG